MIENLLAILTGLLLVAGLFKGEARQWVNLLRPWETVIGVVAIVVGVLQFASLLGIGLILGGLILASSAMAAIPSVGDDLKRWGRQLEQFGVLIGGALLLLALIRLLS